MAQLAIRGHKNCGEQVIKILEMLSGVNKHNYIANCESLYFYISPTTSIICYDLYCFSNIRESVIFTLEEFLEKYPYKIGDKVLIDDCDSALEVVGMKWDKDTVKYEVYTNDYGYWFSACELQPYKEEIMEKEISGAIVDRFICLEGYDFYDDKGNIIDTKEITMKKQLKYPKTYDVCLEILGYNTSHTVPMNHGHKGFLIMKFQRLLICRDAYWKIAGDWEPDWEDGNTTKYTISCVKNKIELRKAHEYTFTLAFPTEEMRDAFYENFKKLIEECKELL